ncbi:Sterol O-acyltransferase 2 [Camponotus japonicus]
MNAWAEMLRFADRLFYKDWWNSTSFPMWNRTWNVVIYDWLYTYLYKDMYEVVVPRNKPLAIFTVFFVSAVCHEYKLQIRRTHLGPGVHPRVQQEIVCADEEEDPRNARFDSDLDESYRVCVTFLLSSDVDPIRRLQLCYGAT